jgi:multidrug resistance efflux pump
LKKKQSIYIALALAVIIIALGIIFKPFGTEDSVELTTKVTRGPLEVTVTTTGELQALNSENINGPTGLRQANIYQVKITDLIPEGSVVKPGDYIATLDKSEASAKMKDIAGEVDKFESQYLQTRLDTAIEMRKLRDDLENMKDEVKEKELVLSQSQFEAPAIIKQAQLDLDKAKRNLEQAKKNYNLKLQQNKAKMQEVSASLNQQKAKLEQMMSLMEEFTVKAPKGGMLFYKRDWNGNKIKVGSQISPWDPTVATLPDLSVMMSRTYINEIDISKIKIGQVVAIGVDAFPQKKYHGKVLTVANAGEQLPGNETKVFEVTIIVDDKDTLLRPAMTTSNIIQVQTLPKVLHIPLEALQGNDSFTYVYKKSGSQVVKQEVRSGISSSDRVEIKEGLSQNDELLLTEPENEARLKVVRLSGSSSKSSASVGNTRN